MADILDDSGSVEAQASASPDERGPDDADDILREALARFELAQEAERETRKLALDDLEFISGKQWPDVIQQDRERDGRPCLVINRLPQFVQQVTNDQRQNRPTVKIHPLDNAASEETAEVIQGLIRHIAYQSNADVARDTAFEGASRSSFGFYRVVTRFVSPDSFDQEIYIERIRNQFTTFLDPYAKESDGSDAEWGFIADDLSPEKYRREYPASKLARPGEWESAGNQSPNWVKSDFARVAEYFYKEYRDTTIHQLSNGETVQEENLAERLASAAASGVAVEVVRSRSVKVPVVKWLKLNGVEILDETTWPGIYVPIIPVYGNELFINGKRILESVVRHAKDPQRMLNFWKSAEAETIALAPRAPFIGVEGQFEGHEEKWKTANKRNHAYLEYKPTASNGQPAPQPPQRQAFEPAVQAITQSAMQAAEDLKATTGIYDASLGAQSNEIAGVAIKARNRQAQTSNFHLTDNLTRSIRYEGRILVDLIPKIYDASRAARIIGDDGTHKIVMLNQKHEDESGKEVLYDVTVGRYDVTVDTGPSYATKREEAAASMMDFSRAVPQVAQACADLIAKNMDWPGAQEISDRLKKMLPPALQDDGKQKDIPPQVIAQMQQMGQMVDHLSKELSEATKVIETKKLDLEHRERVEIMKLQVESEIAMAKMGSQESIALLNAKFQEMEHRLTFLQMNQPIEAPDNFDPQQADGGNFAGIGHIGGTTNLTGEDSPGPSMEGT